MLNKIILILYIHKLATYEICTQKNLETLYKHSDSRIISIHNYSAARTSYLPIFFHSRHPMMESFLVPSSHHSRKWSPRVHEFFFLGLYLPLDNVFEKSKILTGQKKVFVIFSTEAFPSFGIFVVATWSRLVV